MAFFASLIAFGILAAVGWAVWHFFVRPLGETTRDVARRYDTGTDMLRERLAQEEVEMQKARSEAEAELRRDLGGE